MVTSVIDLAGYVQGECGDMGAQWWAGGFLVLRIRQSEVAVAAAHGWLAVVK